jgi:DNA processing protein
MEWLHRLALLQADGIGCTIARRLVLHYGSAAAVFRVKKAKREILEGMSSRHWEALSAPDLLEKAEKHLAFIRNRNIQMRCVLDQDFPERLKHIDDPPFILFSLGNFVADSRKVLGIVGTRANTSYGESVVNGLVEELKGEDVLVVSGLALGIDGLAHRACLNHRIPTVGVLGHGLHLIYPASHRRMAFEMLQCGGLVTEFLPGVHPAPENFPRRNRIIAGLADATVVIESREFGGSIITADLAFNYNRDVFAVPGRVSDELSAGCNKLIRTDRAHLVQHPSDILVQLGWREPTRRKKAVQRVIFPDMSDDEKRFVAALTGVEKTLLEELALKLQWPASKMAMVQLQLESKGVIRVLPGRVCELVQ